MSPLGRPDHWPGRMKRCLGCCALGCTAIRSSPVQISTVPCRSPTCTMVSTHFQWTPYRELSQLTKPSLDTFRSARRYGPSVARSANRPRWGRSSARASQGTRLVVPWTRALATTSHPLQRLAVRVRIVGEADTRPHVEPHVLHPVLHLALGLRPVVLTQPGLEAHSQSEVQHPRVPDGTFRLVLAQGDHLGVVVQTAARHAAQVLEGIHVALDEGCRIGSPDQLDVGPVDKLSTDPGNGDPAY